MLLTNARALDCSAKNDELLIVKRFHNDPSLGGLLGVEVKKRLTHEVRAVWAAREASLHNHLLHTMTKLRLCKGLIAPAAIKRDACMSGSSQPCCRCCLCVQALRQAEVEFYIWANSSCRFHSVQDYVMGKSHGSPIARCATDMHVAPAQTSRTHSWSLTCR